MKLFEQLMDTIMNDSDALAKPIVAMAELLPTLRHYFDMWHMIKNDKTRKIRSDPDHPQYLLPGCQLAAFSTATLLKNGVPEHILDKNPYREMDDPSTKLLFSIDVIQRAFAAGDFALAVSLLPAYLTHTAVLLPFLLRAERIRRLSLAFAIISKFCEIWESQSPGSKKYNSNAAWTRELDAKYLTLILALIAELKKFEDVNLAALGSHLVEHFFALIKRLIGVNQTADDFVRCVFKAIVQTAALNDLNLTLASKGKSTDSGAMVMASDKSDDGLPFCAYIAQAECFFKMLDPNIPCFTLEDAPGALEEVIAGLAGDRKLTACKTWSTSSLRVTSTANTSQRVALSVAAQIGGAMKRRQ
jgi:hypothetical protein